MRILVVVAHPDDAEFGCAGTVAKLAKSSEVFYLSCTSGEMGIEKNISVARKRGIREGEQRKAAEILGVKKVFFLMEKDCEVENTFKLRKKTVAVIRKVKPNIVFTFDPANTSFDNIYLFHSDHRNVALAAFDAVYPRAGNRNFGRGEPHKAKEFWFFGTDKPNKWVDISSTINLKINALLTHRSQISGRWSENKIKRFVLSRAREAGKKKGMKYAEAFRVLKFPE